MTVSQEFTYLCGCPANLVGQSFEEHGRLVCPKHHVGLAPYDKPAPRYSGRLHIELLIVADTREQASAYADEISERMLMDDVVRAAETILEDR